ncbi:MAG: hypothetical protein AMXMBFR84_29850 [Candidatus Hydrogenedentota bacterium]
MNLFGIALTNTAVIAGGLALFVPYVVHLLTRKTPRRIVFPTIRFVRKAEASQSTLFKLRHVLLLLVRTAFVALLLFAFLKPVFQPRSLVAAGGNEGQRAAIIVLDCSASMAYSGEGFSPMARARTAAENIIDTLRPGDAANVIFARAQPAASLDEPSDNRFHLKRDIAEAKPTQERANLDAALAEAVRQLSLSSAPLKEIHLVSDFQRTNWGAVNFEPVPSTVNVVFVPASPEMPENIAITEISVYPPIPAATEEMEITCRVSNFTGSPQEVPVQLAFGAETNLEETISLNPNFSASATFRVRVPKSGNFEGTATIPDHGLKADDKRLFTVNVTDRLHVAVMSQVPPTDRDGSTRFLMRAIDPFAEAGANASSAGISGAFFARYYDRSALASLAAEHPQVLILDRAPAFGSKDAEHLLQYVSGGGALIYFLSESSDKQTLETLQAASNGTFRMPFAMADLRDYRTGSDATYASIGGANFDDPMLRKFRDSGELINIQVYQHFVTDPASATSTLMRFGDGGVAMARASLGTGMVLLCNFSPGLEFSDLAKRALFVPLLHEMMKGARASEGAARSFLVGEAASTTVRLSSTAKEIQFTDPTGQLVNAGFERTGEEASVIFPLTATTGFYRVHADDSQTGSIAVNLDNRESNLECLTVEQLEQLSRLAKDRMFAAMDTGLASLRDFTQGRPLWHYLLLGAMLAIALEQGILILLRR